MKRHVHVINRDGDILTTYEVGGGVDQAEIREHEYFEEARRRAKDENLVEHEAELQALRFQFATGPR